MLRARLVPLRVALQPCSAESLSCRRSVSDRKGGRPPHNRRNVAPLRPGNDGDSDKRKSRRTHESAAPSTPETAPKKPSLIEQLFPEETKRREEQQRVLREVPPLPLDKRPKDTRALKTTGAPDRNSARAEAQRYQELNKAGVTRAKWERQAEIKATGPGVGVLVLRNASKNLTEEDFRRLIPQGRHIEGWTPQQGDILKVIPDRDLDTLEQTNVYYILFTSATSAFTYQGHVTKIHILAAAHQPTSLASPISPPPGYMIEGLDAHAAIQSYALVPPSQRLELRQLKSPFTPVIASVVANGGFEPVVSREGKMPFEARLTMEGPQLQPSVLRHIMNQTGRQRGLSWSGGENFDLPISRWEPYAMPNATSWSDFAVKRAGGKVMEVQEANEEENGKAAKKRRKAAFVYIVGFHTEIAAQTFVTYWHHRRLESADMERHWEDDGDLPPVANVEMLW